MNTYRMEPTVEGFRVFETSSDGNTATRDFHTAATARIWIVRRATIANMAHLARWLWGNAPKTPGDD
jgi:hypothetical protein